MRIKDRGPMSLDEAEQRRPGFMKDWESFPLSKGMTIFDAVWSPNGPRASHYKPKAIDIRGDALVIAVSEKNLKYFVLDSTKEIIEQAHDYNIFEVSKIFIRYVDAEWLSYYDAIIKERFLNRLKGPQQKIEFLNSRPLVSGAQDFPPRGNGSYQAAVDGEMESIRVWGEVKSNWDIISGSRGRIVDECAGSIIIQTIDVEEMEYLQSHEEKIIQSIRETGQLNVDMLLFWPYVEKYDWENKALNHKNID